MSIMYRVEGLGFIIHRLNSSVQHLGLLYGIGDVSCVVFIQYVYKCCQSYICLMYKGLGFDRNGVKVCDLGSKVGVRFYKALNLKP
jgi:hypothetical protein